MNGHRQTIRARGVVALIAAVVMGVLGLRASSALADEPIVGFWQVTFTDKATGKVASYVWDVWHSDRTETQNDTGNILSGNVCQGAWVPLGKRTYGLTHPAFIFADPTHPEFGWTEENEGQFVSNSCVILERVRVDKSGNNYSGPGIIKCVAGVDPLDPAATPLGPSEEITISAKRVSVDLSQLPSSD